MTAGDYWAVAILVVFVGSFVATWFTMKRNGK